MLENTVPINIVVTFRQTEPTDALKQYAIEKLTTILRKYVHAQTDVKVILNVQKRDQTAEVLVHSKGYDASGTATTEDLYSSIDKVADTITAQLRRQKERAVERHRSQDVHS